MAMLKVPKGQHFIKRGSKMKTLYLIIQGKVRQKSKNDEIQIGSGNMIGIMECIAGNYQNDYMAEEECILYSFSYLSTADFNVIFDTQPKYAPAFLTASYKEATVLIERYQKYYQCAYDYYVFCIDMNRQYKLLCSENNLPEKVFHCMEKLETMKLSQKIGQWEVDYYHNIALFSLDKIELFCDQDYALVIGQIMNSAESMVKAENLIDEIKEYLQYLLEHLLGEKKADLFQLFFDLEVRVAAANKDISDVQKQIDIMMEFIREEEIFDTGLVHGRFQEYEQYDFSILEQKDLLAEELAEEHMLSKQEGYEDAENNEEESEDCFVHILKVAEVDLKYMKDAKNKIKQYRELPDIYATDEKTRKLRKDLSRIFYDTYRAVFKHTITEENLSPIVKMFLNFGFMDVQTVGENNANDLYDLTDKLMLCKSKNIFTMYEWLKSIYKNENEPCKNEFDMDYTSFLHEQKRMGKISAEKEEELKKDNWAKVDFELDNMFVSTNRATYGNISTFCPILSEKDIINSVENMLVTSKKIEEAMENIRNIDFSIFYHEVMFMDSEHGIQKEVLQKEILPNIILMPNAGTKAMMWQETAGIKRNTPARFIFPIMTIANVPDMMLELCGRYRWEICRKMQGMRWNDITERSLTSEYCDYLQFYRKNKDLSTDAKEKVRHALIKAKNNYREVFVADYINWIKYESNGSFRLNKLVRDIIFRYCPFNKEIREKLSTNPMYQDIFNKYDILIARKSKHVQNFCNKYVKSGGEMTVALQENIEFYNL